MCLTWLTIYVFSLQWNDKSISLHLRPEENFLLPVQQWVIYAFCYIFFFRLTPPYMLFMMVYVCLGIYMYNGPQWSQTTPLMNGAKCMDYWWRNLLYINNFFPVADMVCYIHSL